MTPSLSLIGAFFPPFEKSPFVKEAGIDIKSYSKGSKGSCYSVRPTTAGECSTLDSWTEKVFKYLLPRESRFSRIYSTGRKRFAANPRVV